ncbi:MAG TPA: aldo/keto reductase [Patescibacteria group bacterium]|nr:aldo/keto reductase [Patescibacteria group bacterium]
MDAERRPLGRRGLSITRLGFGAWSIGGPGLEYHGTAQRDAESVRAMLHAFERGVGWIDTAPIYGNGHSEDLVGRALKAVRGDRPLVFTKCGRLWDSPESAPRSDLRPSAIRSGCEASLRRLGVDAIDLLQFHWPDRDTDVPVEESWGEMMRLIDEGKIRSAGVCNFDRPLLERCEAVGHVDCLQTPLSLIVRDSAGGLIQWCAEHRVGVIVYSPMQVGLLTDTFSVGSVAGFEPDDWRRNDPEFRSPRLERNLALRDALRPIAEAHSSTVAAIAVAWTLAWSQVTGAIVGARTPDQVEGWIGAGAVHLSRAELEAVAEALVSTGAGRGPLAPGPYAAVD